MDIHSSKYIYVYIHLHKHAYTHTYIHIYIYICIHVYICTHVHICTYIFIYMYIYTYRWGSRDVGPEEWQRLMAEIRARHGKLANFLSKHTEVFELRSRPGGKEIRLVPTGGMGGYEAGGGLVSGMGVESSPSFAAAAGGDLGGVGVAAQAHTPQVHTHPHTHPHTHSDMQGGQGGGGTHGVTRPTGGGASVIGGAAPGVLPRASGVMQGGGTEAMGVMWSGAMAGGAVEAWGGGAGQAQVDEWRGPFCDNCCKFGCV